MARKKTTAEIGRAMDPGRFFSGARGLPSGRLRIALAVAGLAGLWLADRNFLHLSDHVAAWMAALHPAAGPWALAAGALVYALLLSVPFVPGMELGFALMVLFGVPGVVMGYLGTLVGLNLAFAAGRWMRPAGGDPAGALPAPPPAEFPPGEENPSGGGLRWRLRRLLARYQYLLLAVLLNFPGNTVIGGGGGIGIAFGMSRRTSWVGFFVTTALATAGVPVLFLLGLRVPWPF